VNSFRFFSGVLLLLLVFALFSVLYLQITGYQTERVNSIFYAGTIAFLNITVSFLVLKTIINFSQEKFNKYFFGSMGLRLVILIVIILTVLKNAEVIDFVFITALIILHFSMQIWEVFFLNTKLNRKQPA